MAIWHLALANGQLPSARFCRLSAIWDMGNATGPRPMRAMRQAHEDVERGNQVNFDKPYKYKQIT
jgi:hypothetical protein